MHFDETRNAVREKGKQEETATSVWKEKQKEKRRKQFQRTT